MKVAFVIPNTLRTKSAGLEQSVYFLAKEFQKKGVEVEIYCTAQHAQKNVMFDGIPLKEFPRFAPRDTYYLSWPLFRALRRCDADVIHAYGYNTLPAVAAVLAKKKNQQFFLTTASSVSSSQFRRALRPLLAMYYEILQKRIDKIIFLSTWEKNIIRKDLRVADDKCIVFPSGIDSEGIRAVSAKKIPHSILSVGRLVKNKGMHHLISALPLVRKKYPDTTLHIVGDGVERAALKAQAEKLGVGDAVFFHGHIEFSQRKKLYELYAQSTIFSLLSDTESQGLVYGMALAIGQPVLAPHQSAMLDLVNVSCVKSVKNTSDAHEVAEGILSLFDHPKKCSNVDSVVWSWSHVCDEILALYTAAKNP